MFFEKTFVHFEFVSTVYLKLYDEITNNEIKLAHINVNDKVLVIGSGSIPATAILIAQKTGAFVTGVDRDYRSALYGNRYTKQHHFDVNLHVSYADGSTFDISSYDVIIVAYGIQDEPRLFSFLGRDMDSTARVIYRQPYDRTFSDTSLPDFIQSSFVLVDRIISQSLGSIYSLLLVKKNNSSIED
jgi:hypothetical protein